jgi:hypothetical protein
MPGRAGRRPRNALLWGACAFVALQAGLAFLVEQRWPMLRDPEYGWKWTRLRALLAERPGRPLVVVLGTSRADLGFRPDALPALQQDAAVVFNFAVTGAGPLGELLQLQRLLSAGVCPDWVIVEVLPPLLHQPPPVAEENRFSLDRLSWAELQLFRRYWPAEDPHRGAWWAAQLPPCFAHRYCLLSELIPAWLPGDVRCDCWHTVDRFGWLRSRFDRQTPAEHRRKVELARQGYLPYLQGFHISANADRALRELLDECRQHGIGAVFVTLPESSEFRSWYAAETLALIAAYLKTLEREYGVPWVDARSWAADGDFFDGHHLVPHGATMFTERLGREVLPGLLAKSVSGPGPRTLSAGP